MQRIFIWSVILTTFLGSCSISKNIPVTTKLSPSQLQEDFSIVKGVLYESHPSLNWFTPQDSIDLVFSQQEQLLTDSMSILNFKHFISYTLSSIKCAHTSCSFTKHHLNRTNNNGFVYPFLMSIIGDSLVTRTVNDSITNQNFIRGTIIKRINEYPAKEIIETLKHYVQTDGNNESGKIYQLNGGSILNSYFQQIMSRDTIWNIEFINRFGNTETANFKLTRPIKKDSSEKTVKKDTTTRSTPIISLNNIRSLQIDTSLSSGFMTINSFKGGGGLNSFYRKSFKKLQENNIQYLIIDLRRNGGGLMSTTSKLLRYTKDSSFKMVEENYGITRKSSYRKYIPNYLKNRMINLFASKEKDGYYHLTFHEKTTIKPKKKNHFKGEIFVLTSGYTYSASAIFAQKLKSQSNVTIVGDETGGGSYGTTAMAIYKLELPNSKIAVNVPLYKIIIDSSLVEEGRGVIPDVYLPTTLNDFRMRRDPVINYLKEFLTKSSVD